MATGKANKVTPEVKLCRFTYYTNGRFEIVTPGVNYVLQSAAHNRLITGCSGGSFRIWSVSDSGALTAISSGGPEEFNCLVI